MEELIKDYKNGIDLYSICEKYHFGKLKVKKILADNGVELRKRGGQTKSKPYVISDWKVIKYPKIDGYHYIAKDKNSDFITNDYMNDAGVLTTYIKKEYNIEIPTLYDRREYYKLNGSYWWEQWFDIISVEDKAVKKCPYCDWETVDVENKSGAFEMHLKNTHNKTIEDYLKDYPQDKEYFKKYSKKVEREKLFSNDKYYVTCPICHEKLKKITLWHCKSKHNMTLSEFRKKFEHSKVVSEYDSEIDSKNFKLGNLTYTKNRFISSYEQEIREFLDKNKIKYEGNRQILIGKEIDILIPSLMIGIEFDGLKWHTEEFGHKDKNYHVSKTDKCNEQGYSLIHIFEDEYVNNKELIYHKLSHLLKLDYGLPKIYGRKLEVKEIYMNEAKNFLNKFHIQGFVSSTIYLGGFFNKQLVAVMSFKHGNVKNTNWELTRFATDYNYIYQGVGGKIFSFFIKNYEPNVIISFADRRWTLNSDNNLYTKLGFKLESINKPDYRYYNERVDRFKRIHKMTFNKQALHKKYGFPLTMTEREMTKELGYDRIWDCGLFKYVWRIEEINEV